MKKLSIVLAILIAMFVIVSCDGEKATAKGLVGTWKAVYIETTFTETAILKFDKSGSGSYTITYAPVSGDPETQSESFTWSAANNILTIKSSELEESYPYTLTANDSVLTFAEGTKLDGAVFERQ